MHLTTRTIQDAVLMLASVGLLVGAVVFSPIAGADQESNPIDDALVSDSMDVANVFGGTPQRPEVKDLYLTIYKSLKVNPDKAAMRATANHYQYSQTEMQGILKGDLGLLRRTQNELMTLDDSLNMLQDIQTRFEKEKADEKLRQQLFVDSYPKEIFVNGDAGDSGFDVVYDLEIIELILFGDQSIAASGPSGTPGLPFGFPNQNGSGDEAGPESPANPGPSSSGPGPSDSSSSDNDDTETSDGDEDNTPDEPSYEDIVDGEPTDEPLDPRICVSDPGVQDAFSDYLEDHGEGNENNSNNSSTNTDNSNNNNEPQTRTPLSHPDPRLDGAFSRNTDGSLNVESPHVPNPAHEWGDEPNLCNDVFCLIVKFTNRPSAQAEISANCIQCHVQHTVEGLRETTSASLTPGKVSGNMMEPSTCKKSLFSGGISLNFIPVGMPILTPGATELITGVDFGARFSDFMESTWGVNFDDANNTPQTRSNSAVRQSQTQAYSGQTTASILEEAFEAYDQAIAEIEAQFDESYLRARFDGTANFYEAARYEMDQMNLYFQSFEASIVLAQEVLEDKKNNLEPAS